MKRQYVLPATHSATQYTQCHFLNHVKVDPHEMCLTCASYLQMLLEYT